MSIPTVLRLGRFRFFDDNNERQGPPHIHVRGGGDEAKFWLDPIVLTANHGFNGREMREIERIVGQHRAVFLEAWDEYYG